MSQFDYEKCKTRDKCRAISGTHGEVEVIAREGDEFWIKTTTYGCFTRHVSQLSNLSPPVPAEPEVVYVAVRHHEESIMGVRGRFTSNAFKNPSHCCAREEMSELHAIRMGCLDPQELWDKHGIAVSPYLYRDRTDWRIGRRDAVRGESWNVLSVTGGWIQHSCDNVSREATFPTYGSALKAASDAAKSL